MQVLQEGGENNMHAHPAQDGIWIVLKGRVKFYGKGDVVLAELGPLQGIHIPRGFYYWFESSSPEMLEITPGRGDRQEREERAAQPDAAEGFRDGDPALLDASFQDEGGLA